MLPSRSSYWPGAAGAPFVGWLLATALLLAGVRSLGWIALAALAATLLAGTLYGRGRAVPLSEFAAFTLAFALLEWPVLGILTLLLLSWAGVAHWG
jgi:hypothetical protein